MIKLLEFQKTEQREGHVNELGHKIVVHTQVLPGPDNDTNVPRVHTIYLASIRKIGGFSGQPESQLLCETA